MLVNTINANRIIKESVIKGENATLSPSLLPFFKVSEIARVRRGPGDNPAAKPRAMPVTRNSIPAAMIENYLLTQKIKLEEEQQPVPLFNNKLKVFHSFSAQINVAKEKEDSPLS